jgi:hypothetical protein
MGGLPGGQNGVVSEGLMSHSPTPLFGGCGLPAPPP